MVWATFNISFMPRWADPWWEVMGYDVGPLTEEIGTTLLGILAEASSPPHMDLSVDEIEDALGIPSVTWPFGLRSLFQYWSLLLNLVQERWANVGSLEGFLVATAYNPVGYFEPPATSPTTPPSP
ncbi:unnamed protein product [Prorocentrum cordatum]|uniref:Uncharacterized protein n=1 Tax=Prorocentrum cordatum TaxID=2364126 RepID=A0ABN9U8N9_9DINO|nr:unnamed protein product [Polarella glacialis]